MEGEVMARVWRKLSFLVMVLLGLHAPGLSYAQGQATSREQDEVPQMTFRKTPIKSREYQGKMVEGEERVISKGDSLWRILIQEKGFSEKRFNRYMVVISALNPHLKKPDILRVGDTVFIPIKPDEILGIQMAADKTETRLYRVKRGDFLYKILQEEFGVRGKTEVRSAFSKVRELNPGKKNWNLLAIGEGIVFPGSLLAQPQTPRVVAVEPAKPTEVVGLDDARKLPAYQNLDLLEQVMAALGNETRRAGQEAVPLQEGTVHIDRESYPVVHNPKLEQKVILDLEDKIPASLRSELEKRSDPTPVVSAKKGASLHEVVNSLLPRLGYQSLPADRPVVVHEGGVGLQVKGEWMVTGPEESGGKQEIHIVTLTEASSRTPDYITRYLSLKGMKLKEILLPSRPIPTAAVAVAAKEHETRAEFESWPTEKSALVDAFLKTYGITFLRDEQLTVSLRQGIWVDAKIDRFLELGGRKVAFLFRAVADELKKALEEKGGVRPIELDLQSLNSRELVSRLLGTVGERTAYREHRFPANERGAREKVVLTVTGFFLPNRSLLLTDSEIPRDLQRFFAEKGMRVVYFR